MDYSGFSVSPLAVLSAVALGVILGVVTVVLARNRSRTAALATGISSTLLITAWVLANGMIETARTNEILDAAKQVAVPDSFEPGKAENHRGGRIVRATAFMPRVAYTAPCPYVHRQWSAPEGMAMTRNDFDRVILESGWRDKLVVAEKTCRFVYTNSNYIGCHAEGVVEGFRTALDISQHHGDVWRLTLSMGPAR